MRVSSTATRSLALVLGFALTAGCRDEHPTLVGLDQFPAGLTPTTIELVLPAAEFLSGGTVFDAYTAPNELGFLVVADRFDGELRARALARITGFPDTLVYTAGGTSRTDTDFEYVGGRVRAVVDDTASAGPGPVTLRLWAATQEWDAATTTWTHAVDRPGEQVAWRTAGGALAGPLASATWIPGDTATINLAWALDSLMVRQMAAEGFPGVIVTAETAGSRVQLRQLSLDAEIRPAGAPDTTITRTLTQGERTFIFSPEQPTAAGAFRVGGVGSARTVFRLDLSQGVPGCANPAQTPNCPRLPLSEVTLNRATLLLDPLPVPQGFRPLVGAQLSARRVAEPELGRQAPLGALVAFDSVAAAVFRDPAGTAVSVDLTRSLVVITGDQAGTAAVALLVEPEGANFGALWFGAAPRLRLLYTLPLRPELP